MLISDWSSDVCSSDLKGVVTTMIQTEKYGTPLASALRVLSAEFRNERMMRAEEKAARLPAIMTVPLIPFILPGLFIVLPGPAALAIPAHPLKSLYGGGKSPPTPEMTVATGFGRSYEMAVHLDPTGDGEGGVE